MRSSYTDFVVLPRLHLDQYECHGNAIVKRWSNQNRNFLFIQLNILAEKKRKEKLQLLLLTRS